MAATATTAKSQAAPAGLAEKAALQYEVEQFFYREAALLDERKYRDWLELLADDIHYWMPIRRTVTRGDLEREFTKIGDMSYFDDDKRDLAMRIEKLEARSAWSENPPSRTRHFVSNVRIGAWEGDEIEVELAFHFYRSRLNDAIDNWIGKRQDRLRRVEGGFQICQRHIFLDQTVIRSNNFSSLF